MEVKKITVTAIYEDEKNAELQFTPDQEKSVFENAAAALQSVKSEDSYFSAAGITAENDPDIYTHEDFEDILASSEKEFFFSWWGKNYSAGVEVSVIVTE